MKSGFPFAAFGLVALFAGWVAYGNVLIQASGRLFSTLTPESPAFKIEHVEAYRETLNGQPVLHIHGTLRSRRARATTPPSSIHLALLDATGYTLYTWTAKTENNGFETRLLAPPDFAQVELKLTH